MSFKDEFLTFLEEYGVIGLAIAFVIGAAVKDLVSVTVDTVIMPIVEIFLPEGNWQNAVLNLAGIELQIRVFLAALIDFLIIALLIFIFIKYILKKEKVEKI